MESAQGDGATKNDNTKHCVECECMKLNYRTFAMAFVFVQFIVDRFFCGHHSTDYTLQLTVKLSIRNKTEHSFEICVLFASVVLILSLLLWPLHHFSVDQQKHLVEGIQRRHYHGHDLLSTLTRTELDKWLVFFFFWAANNRHLL